MKIHIKDNNRFRFRMHLPSVLVLNPLSARLIAKRLRKQGLGITGRQAAAFSKSLNRYRREHPEWLLVEVLECNGTQITVQL